MMKAIAIACGLLAVAGQAVAQATPVSFEAPAAASPEALRAQLLRDQAECGAEGAKRGRLQTAAVPVNGGGLAGVLIGAFVVGTVTGVTQAHLTRSFTVKCMAARGYQPIDLTAAQAAELKAIPSRREQLAWLAATPLYAPMPANALRGVSYLPGQSAALATASGAVSADQAPRTWSVTR